MEFKPRKLLDEVLRYWDSKPIHVIRGPRRSGKTTLLLYLNELKGGTYITFEELGERDDFLNDPVGYIKRLPQPIFLDEFQYLGERGGQTLKRIYDTLHTKGLKLIVSGSGAFDIKTNMNRFLVGRAYFYQLLPLSFEEYVSWTRPDLLPVYKEGHQVLLDIFKGKKPSEPSPSKRLEELFRRYLILGGYPEVVLKGEIKELESIAFTTIEEDIIDYFGLRENLKLWNVSRRLATLIGNLLEYSSLGVDYRTAENYLSILKQSYVIDLLQPFYTNPLTELTKSKKLYFIDLGFRNALLEKYQPYDRRDDLGALLENFVFRQLIDKSIRYWRTKNKAEVDFILTGNNILPIEVKSGTGRPTRSLYSFITKYNPKTAVIVGFEPSIINREIPIYIIPPYYF